MLEQLEQGTRPYYEALKKLTPDQLKAEWQEITLDQYWYLMEVVPPRKMHGQAFMVGECMTHTEHGPVYEAVTCVLDDNGAHYFARPAYLQSFNPETYAAEIRAQFNL